MKNMNFTKKILDYKVILSFVSFFSSISLLKNTSEWVKRPIFSSQVLTCRMNQFFKHEKHEINEINEIDEKIF